MSLQFDGLKKFMSELDSQVKSTIDETISAEIPKLKEVVEEATKTITENRPLKIEYNSKVNQVKGLRHNTLDKLILVTSQRQPVLIVGMAGTGKTHAAEQVSQALGLDFYAISVGSQTSKSDIMGYMHANGGYVESLFRKAYEHGGVFLMDEIDAGNANVLIQVNAALSNGYAAFPDQMVKRHDDFIFIASANTFGNGANRQYVGRNQLDAATLDRFTTIVWDVDNKLESKMVSNYSQGSSWLKVVKALRDKVTKDSLRVLITPRATIKGSQLLEIGMQFEEVLDMTILESVPNDKKDVLRELAKKNWQEKKAKGVTTTGSGTLVEPILPPEEGVAVDPKVEPQEAEIVW